MDLRPSMHLASSLRAVSRAGGAAVIWIGCLVLMGWMLAIEPLKSLFPGMVTMKANTALSLALSGILLRSLPAEPAARRTSVPAYICAGIILAIGLLTIGEYLLDRNLGIDELLFRDRSAVIKTSSPGRMAPNTAVAFILVGIALSILHWNPDRGFPVAQVLCYLTTAIALLAIIGYMYGVESLYGIGRYTRMALHTAIGFFMIGASILLFYPTRGVLSIITSNYAGGILGRRLTPAAILIPPILGLLLLLGRRAQLYETETEFTLFALLSVFVFAVLTLTTSRSLNLLDSAGQSTERSLRDRLQERVDTELEARREAQRLEQAEREGRQLLEQAVADYLGFMQRVAQGDLTQRLATQLPGALGQLGQSLNEMVESLDNSFRAKHLAQEETKKLQEEIIRVQKATLAELSTPLIPISERVVAMPLIGAMNAERAQRVLEVLLAGIAESRARVAILDITGVPSVDTHVADGLIRAAKGVRLLGAQAVLTGIRPEVAHTLVSLGIDFTGIVTERSLQSGIEYAMAERLDARSGGRGGE
jgi:anti-anti-sigma regulatory factor